MPFGIPYYSDWNIIDANPYIGLMVYVDSLGGIK